MITLLNLATLKKGGGQNVALNFLGSLEKVGESRINFHFVVVKDSDIHKYLVKKNITAITLMPRNALFRMIKEIIFGHYIISKYKIDLIYTYFGIGLYPFSTPQVSGSADSNLFFPEIDFWSNYSYINKLIKRIIDKYRIWGLKKMKAIIFENEIMQKRSIELFNLKNTVFIKPSINILNENISFELPLINQKNKGLFFCGWHKNKNFMIIPFLALELKKRDISFHFLITANRDNSADYLEFQKNVKILNVQDRISIIGSVKKEEIASLYEQIDFVFLLSKLESFSNNIIEAWHFEKALIISDELWSRTICKKSAFYVDRNNINQISDIIQKCLTNTELIKSVVNNGTKILSSYPNIEEKTKQELNFLIKIHETN
jgi:glycosyltransferase involved in cell wall biosynthesis